MIHDLRSIQIPKIEDDKQFEYLCRDLYKNKTTLENVSFNGKPGQHQDGVDIFGRNIKDRKWIGLQCKVRSTNTFISRKALEEEINKAEKFNPKIDEYFIVTTLNRDIKTQEAIREIINTRILAFKLDIVFWEDICDLLKEEINYNIYYQYYHTYFADNTTFGHAIGKLINLELGEGTQLDTHYELMIGKIPNYKDEIQNTVNYYRGTYFIINFHERKMETWTHKCFPSDIEEAFRNPYDRFRISQWINSIPDIDSFIYNDESNHYSYLSDNDIEKYRHEQEEQE